MLLYYEKNYVIQNPIRFSYLLGFKLIVYTNAIAAVVSSLVSLISVTQGLHPNHRVYFTPNLKKAVVLNFRKNQFLMGKTLYSLERYISQN